MPWDWMQLGWHSNNISEIRHKMTTIVHVREYKDSAPSKLLLILVNGNLESLNSITTSVLARSAGNCRKKRVICPGYHEGGTGSAGKGMCVSIIVPLGDARAVR